MRRFLTLLFSLVALAATQAALLCAFIGHTVVSSTGFSSLVSTAQQDEQVHAAVKDYARTAVADQLVSALPWLERFRGQIEGASESALSGLVNDASYPQAFHDSVMSFHDSAFSADHRPVLSLKPVTGLVLEKISSPFGISAPPGFDVSLPMPGASLWGQNLYELLARASLWATPLAVIAALAGLFALLTAQRRPLVFGVLGALTALLGFGCTQTAPAALSQLFAFNAPEGLLDVLLRSLGRAAGQQMAQQAWNVVWAGLSAVAIALLWALVSRAWGAWARRSAGRRRTGSHAPADSR